MSDRTARGITIEAPRDLFKFTTADENGGLGGNVGADLGAATNLTRAVAAPERGSHTKTRIFINVPHEVFNFTTADENATDSPFEVGKGL